MLPNPDFKLYSEVMYRIMVALLGHRLYTRGMGYEHLVMRATWLNAA